MTQGVRTRGRGWVASIAGMVLLCGAAAIVLTVIASELQSRADSYFSQPIFASEGPIDIDQAEFDSYNNLLIAATNLMAVAIPLLFCTLAAGAVLLAVLGYRFDRRRARARTAQAEATAAS